MRIVQDISRKKGSCVIQDFSSVPRKIVNASRKRQPSVPHTNRASEARNLRVELIWERVWFFVVQQMLKKNILVQLKYIQKKTLKMRLGLKASESYSIVRIALMIYRRMAHMCLINLADLVCETLYRRLSVVQLGE